MARMESQQKHTRDNMRVLEEIENNDYYRGLVHNMVVDLLSQVDTMSIDLAKQLEEKTAVVPTHRENGYMVMSLSPEYDNGLCRHVAQVLLISELKKNLDHELAVVAAWAIHQGDSKNSVAKAMHKHPSDLFSKRNLIGSDIQRLCAAHDEMEAHPDDPAYDIIPVKLHDGFVYEIHRQKYPHPAADLT